MPTTRASTPDATVDDQRPVRRVAVLGGGVGGLTAAFELTRPDLPVKFEVTVYQLGWRLGGKGASGRGMDRGARIEEHGLHVWFGFYENAFRLMKEVYVALARPPEAPLATVGAAFRPCPKIVSYDRFAGRWHAHPVTFPEHEGNPWDPHPNVNVLRIASRVLTQATSAFDALVAAESAPAAEARVLLEQARCAAEELATQESVELEAAQARLGIVAGFLKEAADTLSRVWEESLTGTGLRPRLRLIYTTLDAFAAAARGIVDDGVLSEGFEVINGEDWACWLRRHGASAQTVGDDPTEWAPAVRGIYDVAFAFPRGDVTHPDAAAGTAMDNLLKLVGRYRGHVAYKMTAGMGDAIVAPIYEVLLARGVEFRFFHAVTGLKVPRGCSSVESIELVRQVDPVDGEYRPLVCVKDLPCWPNNPLWEQLPKAAETCGTRFETELDPLGRKDAGSLTLRRGADFDAVVLAIPVGALGGICADLMAANKEFREMVAVVGDATVRTQAFQVWTSKSTKELGWEHGGDSIASCFVEPLDTVCDMEHLIGVERWGCDDGVNGITYVCGVLDDRDETAEQATARVKQGAIDYLTHDAGEIWRATRPWDWNALADPEDRSGPARFDAQYWRANIATWERYVITPAGSVEKRLPSCSSGFENLVLAGDWTRNGINGGCVEAAVISGTRAAYELAGVTDKIPGEDTRWLTPA